MKILTSKQIRKADKFTIENEPIASIDLMERASEAFVTKFLSLNPIKSPVYVFAGTGNNGGDGLAIARLLKERGWEVEVFVPGDSEKGSPDFKTNLDRLANCKAISSQADFPTIEPGTIIIDGLFGSGLSRPVEGLYAELIRYLNKQKAQRVAIDIASGLYADQPLPKEAIAFQADYTISFQVPKLAFFLPKCSQYVGEWRVMDIGLDKEFIQQQESIYEFTEKEDVCNLLSKRDRFAHKNSVGRLMIVAGSRGKMGAAVLCARAAFRSGVGLVNVHSPQCGVDILQTSIPEAMVSIDNGELYSKEFPKTEDTVAIGPGLGTSPETIKALKNFLAQATKPMVIDADAINIISQNKEMLGLLPEESILTPHPGEFRRLVGDWDDDFDKLEKLRSFCTNYRLNVVLKGAFSAVCNSKGEIYFNSTGNPAMATAGSGDVLTGILGALSAQGLPPFDALKLGVYLHGAAGDEAVRNIGTSWIQASDIINFIPEALGSLKNGGV